MVKIRETLCDIDNNVESFRPFHKLSTFLVKQSVLQATVRHVLVHQNEFPATTVRGEAEEREDVWARERGSDGELVVELTLALERARGVHELES